MILQLSVFVWRERGNLTLRTSSVEQVLVIAAIYCQKSFKLSAQLGLNKGYVIGPRAERAESE